MKRKTNGKKGFSTLKININKAYDRVDWVFLKQMILKLGFDGGWVNLIMKCVKNIKYTALVNDHMVGPIHQGRGLHQGFPFSPYLLCYS